MCSFIAEQLDMFFKKNNNFVSLGTIIWKAEFCLIYAGWLLLYPVLKGRKVNGSHNEICQGKSVTYRFNGANLMNLGTVSSPKKMMNTSESRYLQPFFWLMWTLREVAMVTLGRKPDNHCISHMLHVRSCIRFCSGLGKCITWNEIQYFFSIPF